MNLDKVYLMIWVILKGRKKNAERISKLVAYLSKKNLNIIVSVLSNYPQWLDWNKKNIKNYFQVYLKVR